MEKLGSKGLEYQKLSNDEMKARGILGRLVGPIASCVKPTRNNRLYTEEAWDAAFNNPICQERIKNGLFFGELEHPEDRTETKPENIAVCMREVPKKDNEGHLVGVLDILDTPNGRILNTICKYGSTVGISTRGTGEVTTDANGNDVVDPNTFELNAADIVILPACADARLQYMTESLNGKTLKQSLKEEVEKASIEDKKIMTETINKINEKLNTSAADSKPANNISQNSAKSSDTLRESTKTDSSNSKETINEGSNEMMKSLQEALKDKALLEDKVQELQEKLAVSNAKVNSLNEEVSRFKSSTVNLATGAKQAKELSKKVSTLEEELKKKDEVIAFKNTRITKMLENKKTVEASSKSLNESISKKEDEVKKLNESLASQKTQYESEVKTLKESLDKVNTQLKDSNKMKESYLGLAKGAVDKYISFRAKMLGVSVNEIKNKLPESYSLGDIDTVCESVKDYELSINKLPLAFNRKVKVQVSENKDDKLFSKSMPEDIDDTEVSESLIRLAHLDK